MPIGSGRGCKAEERPRAPLAEHELTRAVYRIHDERERRGSSSIREGFLTLFQTFRNKEEGYFPRPLSAVGEQRVFRVSIDPVNDVAAPAIHGGGELRCGGGGDPGKNGVSNLKRERAQMSEELAAVSGAVRGEWHGSTPIVESC